MDLGLLSWLPHRGGTSCRVMLPLSWALWWTPGPQSELCTLRVRPSDLLGYFSAYQPRLNTSVVYHWERAAFPFLVTWEEDHARTHKPWNGRELTRGLEFSSYALPASREWNVKQGTVMDTPAFQVAPMPLVKCVPNPGAVGAIHLTRACLPRCCSVCQLAWKCVPSGGGLGIAVSCSFKLLFARVGLGAVAGCARGEGVLVQLQRRVR